MKAINENTFITKSLSEIYILNRMLFKKSANIARTRLDSLLGGMSSLYGIMIYLDEKKRMKKICLQNKLDLYMKTDKYISYYNLILF